MKMTSVATRLKTKYSTVKMTIVKYRKMKSKEKKKFWAQVEAEKMKRKPSRKKIKEQVKIEKIEEPEELGPICYFRPNNPAQIGCPR